MASAKSPVVRLRHIRHEITALVSSVEGLGDDAILASHVHRRALERSVEIISEAAKSLPDRLRETEPTMPWKDIIGIGNLLRHEYYRIDDTTMLSILRVHLPGLLPAIDRMERRLAEAPR
ncbi:DUF86 domain-containing protein [Aquibium microcysteis]|jgi:uncharacterized protein with HEPN domain|uniref:HepT-like ribonuclease domain-containing protein n=1 Tax=Aquibium microcysteis TaxID=675281 RepID=UPI00165D0979|nr:HepT-like ribonuclease domain-containing protein [Aquibium microcysteis]